MSDIDVIREGLLTGVQTLVNPIHMTLRSGETCINSREFALTHAYTRAQTDPMDTQSRDDRKKCVSECLCKLLGLGRDN